MFTSFSKTTDVLWSCDRSSRASTLPGETEPDRSETADSTPVRLAHKCRGSGGVRSDGQPNEEGATRQGVTTCAGGLGKWMSLFNFSVLLGQHGGVEQDAGVVPLLCVCGCQNRCKWRPIPCSSGLVDKARLLQTNGSLDRQYAPQNKVGLFIQWLVSEGKGISTLWERQQMNPKLCRLRSQQGSNKNECVCLCVVCSCHQKTLRESTFVTHSRMCRPESALCLAQPL